MFNYNVPHENYKILKQYKKEYDKNPLMVQSIRYYDRYLLQKAMSIFKWDFPENWESNYFLFNLYTKGFICITDYNMYGVIPQHCTISGYNIFYNPAKCIINNPYMPASIKSKEIILGRNGELLTLTPDYCGILDLINTYSEMLANALCAVNTNLYNSRLAYIFYAKNKAQAESFKKLYDEIGTGVPGVVIDNKIMTEDATGNIIPPFFPFNAELQKNYISDKILEDMRRIENMFDREVGIPNMNSEKRERMNDTEINKSDIETMSNISLWHDTLSESLDRVKKLYPDLLLSFDYRFPLANTNNNTNEEISNV